MELKHCNHIDITVRIQLLIVPYGIETLQKLINKGMTYIF